MLQAGDDGAVALALIYYFFTFASQARGARREMSVRFSDGGCYEAKAFARLIVPVAGVHFHAGTNRIALCWTSHVDTTGKSEWPNPKEAVSHRERAREELKCT